MKITTKTGDKGETSLFGGRRVSKASCFIELVGELDELQAVVGWCKVAAEAEARDVTQINRLDHRTSHHLSGISNEVCDQWDIPSSMVVSLDKIVDDIYRIMSIIGFEMKCPKNIEPIGEKDVEFLEKEMAKYEHAVEDLNKFVRPGGSEISARLNIARTVCRRVERGVVGIMDGGGGTGLNNEAQRVLAKILKYLNRLSDLLFVISASA